MIVSLLLTSVGGCGNSEQEIRDLVPVKPLPVEESENVVVYYSEEAKVKVKLEAPVLIRKVDDKIENEMPDGIHLVFYDSLGGISSEIIANYAIDKNTEFLMEARDSVVVTNEKGEKLETEHLIWNRKEEMIHTEEFVTITTGEEIIMGDGLESNQDFTKYRIKNPRGESILLEDE